MTAIYNRLLIGALALIAAVILATSTVVEPLDGDLTRTGGYLERRFGWDGQQQLHDEHFLFTMAESLEELDRPYDVIVIGDSFTRRAGFSWASYLVELTGWRIIGFHHGKLKLQELLDSPQFKRFQPRLVVFQTVERHATRRFSALQKLHGPDDTPERTAERLRLIAPTEAPFHTVTRETEFADINARLSTSVHYLRIWSREAISGERHARVMPLVGGHPPLFSSQDADNILLLEDDFLLRKQAGLELRSAVAGLRNAEGVVGSLGTTFIPLIFPDKLTVYAEYLQDNRWIESSQIPLLAQAVAMPRLDEMYRETVRRGVLDVYAPNNTHMSSAGSRMAAVEFLGFVSAQSLVDLDINALQAEAAR